MDEQELMDLKWYDYRVMPPDLATKVFIREYAKRFVRYFDRLGLAGRHYNTLKTFDITNPKKWRHWSVIELLRQWADAHCMKYDDFWTWAVEASSVLNFKRTFPNTFLHPTIKTYVLQKSKEPSYLRHADYDWLKPEHYREWELQNDYYWYIVKELQRRYPRRWRERLEEMVIEGKMSKDFLEKHLT